MNDRKLEDTILVTEIFGNTAATESPDVGKPANENPSEDGKRSEVYLWGLPKVQRRGPRNNSGLGG